MRIKARVKARTRSKARASDADWNTTRVWGRARASASSQRMAKMNSRAKNNIKAGVTLNY